MRRLATLLLLLAPAAVVAAPFTPTSTPVSPSGTRATVDLPVSQHMRNTGGSDGLGLCVFTSAEHAARWQNIVDLNGYRRWMESRPGGGYPSKVDSTLKTYCNGKGVPVPDYIQHTGGDDTFLDLAIRTGRCPCVTYSGQDDFYRFGIDHMVNLVHLDPSTAAIIDNNRPGTWLWMSRADFMARWRARGGGWAFVFLNAPPPPHNGTPASAEAKCTCECCPSPCPCTSDGKHPKCNCYPCPAKEQKFVAGQQCGPGGCWVAPSGPVGPIVNPFAPVARPTPAESRRIGATDPKWVKHGGYLYLEGYGLYDPKTGLWAPLWRYFGDESGKRSHWGEWQETPEAVKAIVPTSPVVGADVDEPLTGVIPERIHDAPRYSLSGSPCSRDEALSAMGGGSLVDDSGRWHLSIVGDDVFSKKVLADVAQLPADTRAKLHLQWYTPDAWPVTAYKLTAGVTLRKPAGSMRVSEDVGTIPPAEYTLAKLDDALCAPGGPCPLKPKPVDPVTPADPSKPTPPEPNPSLPKLPAWLVILGGAILVYFFRRKQSNGT